jgi:hypothetical protein
MTSYGFASGLDHASIMETADRVAWTVDGVFGGRRFDASKPMVPTSWVGTEALAFLEAGDQLVLNHCRAFSYVHLLGNYEEFIPLHLGDAMEKSGHDDDLQPPSLVRFGQQERKHQALFRRAESVLEESCGHRFARYFDRDKTRVVELTTAILRRPLLSRFLILLALEWGTQRHYVESVKEPGAEALYVDVLKAHWIEEAQHTKWDTLEIARLAAESSIGELEDAFDHVLEIGQLIDATFAGQVESEIETLQRVSGRTFSDDEAVALRDALHRSMSAIVAGVGLTHPSFAKVARELSQQGAARVGIGR